MCDDCLTADDTVAKLLDINVEINRKILQFAENHPSFAKRFEIHDEEEVDKPNAMSISLQGGAPRKREVREGIEEFSIASEWDCAVAFGYAMALNDVFIGIRGENTDYAGGILKSPE